MNKKYKVEVNVERGKNVYLSVTHNGHQWTSINIENPAAEIPLIISALQRHLTSAMHSDGEDIGKSKILDEDLQNCDLPDYGY